jgi:hypothetical protein
MAVMEVQVEQQVEQREEVQEEGTSQQLPLQGIALAMVRHEERCTQDALAREEAEEQWLVEEEERRQRMENTRQRNSGGFSAERAQFLHDDGKDRKERRDKLLRTGELECTFQPTVNVKTTGKSDQSGEAGSADRFAKRLYDDATRRKKEVEARKIQAEAWQDPECSFTPQLHKGKQQRAAGEGGDADGGTKHKDGNASARLYADAKRRHDVTPRSLPKQPSPKQPSPPKPASRRKAKSVSASAAPAPVSPVVNRLYDPEALKQAWFERSLRKSYEEMRGCTFTPTLVSASTSARLDDGDRGESEDESVVSSTTAGAGRAWHQRLHDEAMQQRRYQDLEWEQRQQERLEKECPFHPNSASNTPGKGTTTLGEAIAASGTLLNDQNDIDVGIASTNDESRGNGSDDGLSPPMKEQVQPTVYAEGSDVYDRLYNHHEVQRRHREELQRTTPLRLGHVFKPKLNPHSVRIATAPSSSRMRTQQLMLHHGPNDSARAAAATAANRAASIPLAPPPPATMLTLLDLTVFFEGRDASALLGSAKPSEEELFAFLGSMVQTGMTTPEVQELMWEHFGDAPTPGHAIKSGDGSGVSEEGKDALAKLLDAMALLQMRPIDLFAGLDVDHDRKISREELQAGLKRLGFTDSRNSALAAADIDKLLTHFDTDGDGSIDMSEWKQGVNDGYHERHRMQRECVQGHEEFERQEQQGVFIQGPTANTSVYSRLFAEGVGRNRRRDRRAKEEAECREKREIDECTFHPKIVRYKHPSSLVSDEEPCSQYGHTKSPVKASNEHARHTAASKRRTRERRLSKQGKLKDYEDGSLSAATASFHTNLRSSRSPIKAEPTANTSRAKARAKRTTIARAALGATGSTRAGSSSALKAKVRGGVRNSAKASAKAKRVPPRIPIVTVASPRATEKKQKKKVRAGEDAARTAQLSRGRSQVYASPPDVPTKSSVMEDGHGGQLKFDRDALATIGGAMLSSSYTNKTAASHETQVSEVTTDPSERSGSFEGSTEGSFGEGSDALQYILMEAEKDDCVPSSSRRSKGKRNAPPPPPPLVRSPSVGVAV